MPLTAAQLAQKAINIAKPIQDGINNGTGIPATQQVHDLAGAVIMLGEAVLNSGPASSNESGRYGGSASSTQVVSTKQ